MSRMDEHWQDQQDAEREQEMQECERWHHEQALLKADPAFHDWLDSVNARNEIEFPRKDDENADTNRQ